jgi:hypothetical protein
LRNLALDNQSLFNRRGVTVALYIENFSTVPPAMLPSCVVWLLLLLQIPAVSRTGLFRPLVRSGSGPPL